MRILLRADVDRNAFDAAMGALGLSLLEIVPATPERPRHLIAGHPNAKVYFVEDHRVQARYLLVLGTDVDSWARALREQLPHWSAAELRIAAEREADGAERTRLLGLA